MQNRCDLLNEIRQVSLYQVRRTYEAHNQGEKIFSLGLVHEFYWTKNFSVLTAFVNDKKKQIVTITIDKEKLVGECDCGTTDSCAHVCAVVVAGKYFLKMGYSYYSPYSNEQYEKLSNSLLYGNCYDNSSFFSLLPAGISAYIFPQRSIKGVNNIAVVCSLVKDGVIMIPTEIKAIAALAEFTCVTYQQYDEDIFIRNISLVANHYPLFLYDQNKFCPVIWDANYSVQAITEIDIQKNKKILIRRLVRHNNVVLDDFIYSGYRLIINKTTAMIGTIESYECIPWYHTYQWQSESKRSIISSVDFPLISQSFEINIMQFNTNGYTPKYSLSNAFVFKENGQCVALESVIPQAKMVISSADIKNSYLNGKIVDVNEYLEQSFYHDIDKLMNFRRLAAYKSFPSKSRSVWAKGYFAASCAKNKEELDAVIAEVIANLRLPKDVDVKKYIINPLTAVYKKVQKLPTIKSLLIKDGGFSILSIDTKLYWLFVATPHIAFDGCQKVLGSMFLLYGNTHSIYASLAEFRELLHGYGIDLYVDSKQVKSAHIDIEIDTTNKETDWFELHPEVYYEGQKISSEEWQSIVAGNGLWNRNNEILVIDSKACTALGLLSRWMSNEVGQLTSAKSIAIVPRLRIFDLIELRKNGVKLTISDNDEKLLFSLSNFTAIPKIAIPKKLNCTLREYQKEGYYWLAFLYQHRFGACLADDMGLGKTVQAIALLGAIHEKIVVSGGVSKKGTRTQARHKPHLIVVPTSLIFNWVNEIKNFYPHLTVQEYTTTKNNIVFDSADIFITTYDIVRRDSEKLRLIEFNIIIFDEAQAIKNIVAQRTAAARLLQGDFKLCITGTPLENHIGEYYSIMDLAIPGLLPDYATFKNKGNGSVGAVVHQTRPFILRRTKEVIAKELPEKMESDVYFYMTEKQRSLYTRITQEVRNEVTNAYKNKTKGQASIIALTALLRLRQICISPELVIPAKKIVPSPKIEYLTEQLPGLIELGHAALIFSQFTKCLDIIESELNDAGIKYARIDGSVTLAKRKGIIESFQKDKVVDVLLMSLKTGGVGLNLTRASYVFHVDPWWNAAVENQASDRAYRIGQKNTVMVIRLLMHHSIEEKMLVLKKSKEELFKAIVEGAGEKTGSPISQNDFDFLLG